MIKISIPKKINFFLKCFMKTKIKKFEIKKINNELLSPVIKMQKNSKPNNNNNT